nr:hypothetical protein [Staphylococcus aureus]
MGLNLPELIQWPWDNPKLSGNKRFYPNGVRHNCHVTFDVDRNIYKATWFGIRGTEATNFILRRWKQ